jgi:hypothetical protein
MENIAQLWNDNGWFRALIFASISVSFALLTMVFLLGRWKWTLRTLLFGARQKENMKCLLVILLLSPFVFACNLSEHQRETLGAAASTYGLEPALLEALVWQESRYCVDALSPKGAIGLGQLMPNTAVSLGVNPHDAEENLFGAAAYLRAQWDRFESWELALAAYNAGPGAVVLARGIPINGETEYYVPSVLKKYNELATPDDSIPLSITPVVYVKPVSVAVLIPQQGGLNVYTRR